MQQGETFWELENDRYFYFRVQIIILKLFVIVIGLYKYDQEVYDMFMDSFDLMPLSCIVNGKFLALHGGLSPDLKTIDDINKIDRFKEPPKQGIFW